jgi:hypothetical protein
MLEVIQFLHSLDVIHSDIKTGKMKMPILPSLYEILEESGFFIEGFVLISNAHIFSLSLSLSHSLSLTLPRLTSNCV